MDAQQVNITKYAKSKSTPLYAFKQVALILFCLLFTNKSYSQQNQLRVAVAASFKPILEKISADYVVRNNLKIEYISASSGTLYQQIKYGAPFDLFLSADNLRPEKLAQEQHAEPNTLKTYSHGKLALYSITMTPLNLTTLQNYQGKFAIANTKTAPYGFAAKQVLDRLALANNLTLVVGQNVAQTYQQIRSGSVKLGLVSQGQLALNKQKGWLIPSHYYSPITQKMVIPKQAKNTQLALSFQQFLLSDEAQNQLEALGFLKVKYND